MSTNQTRVKLGEVTAPSGRLVLLDVSQLAFAAEIQPAGIEIAGLPRRQPLFVVAQGDKTNAWRQVDIEIQPGVDVEDSEELGDLIVDFAQIMIIDESALASWVHDRSLDGNADLVFWGTAAKEVAQALDAKALADEGDDAFGWRDIPQDRAAELARAVNEHVAAAKLDVDLRRHSHHFEALEQMRRSDTAAATLELAGSKLCLYHTLGAVGLFPVVRQLDHRGQPVRVRITNPEPD